MLLQVATRKGLFLVERGRNGWHPGRPHFPGEPVTQALADPHDGTWYAALRLGHFGVKVKRSGDRGNSWEDVAAPVVGGVPVDGFRVEGFADAGLVVERRLHVDVGSLERRTSRATALSCTRLCLHQHCLGFIRNRGISGWLDER